MDSIPIPTSLEPHNRLVRLIADSQQFSVPEPNKSSGFIIGHINVKEPKPDHPHFCYYPLPIAFVTYTELILVNTDEPTLRFYHDRLKSIATS